MSDSDRDSPAWRQTPSAYLATRSPRGPVSRSRSLYLTMPDGGWLAVDVYLPPESQDRVPAILIFTYYRRFALKAGAPPETEASPGLTRWRDLFVPRGYALVVVDVRGTGASFGTRDSFRSPRERDDYAQMAEWVAAQPWSNGRIGATGDPATAEVHWSYGQTLDPYGIDPDLPEELQQVGRQYFALAPGNDIWVSFYDLPDETRDALWDMLQKRWYERQRLSAFK